VACHRSWIAAACCRGLAYAVLLMVTKLTRVDGGLALVLDKSVIDQLGIDETTELEMWSNGDVFVAVPERVSGEALKTVLDALDRDYGGVFRPLAV